ncbi:Protein of unknown function [Solimonas aquatica]|uniref:DUF1232 domain-containing protein n=1 Tax=Solimonas aquatica TaxID=489703 RepID=A0A1H9GJB8_9GAMM|nr:YkvA family protein [Solimonas aquatica]SEQ50196.1 Protein of unknown function [Solimonas aquatica]
MTEVTEDDAREHLKRSAGKVKPEDMEKILGKQAKIEKIVSGSGPLGKLLNDVKLMFSLIRDYANGSYREVPWASIAAIVGALAYVLSPVDLIPDFIPVVGYMDDAMVVGLCLRLVGEDLAKYAAWKRARA